MKQKPRTFHILKYLVPCGLVTGIISVWLIAKIDFTSISALWHLPFIGVIGATIANASGTGGGVVFLPVFNTLTDNGHLTLSQTNILAASFLIQCFGMTMGTYVWCRKIYAPEKNSLSISVVSFWRTSATILALALPAMLTTQYLANFDPSWIFLSFKIFSICLGLSVIATTIKSRTIPDVDLKHDISERDFKILILIAPIGGFANALFSVGLGEIVALYLFARGYSITTSSGIAVFISSISVLTGTPYHILNDNVPWQVIAFTAPGALLGGYMARHIAIKLGAFRLKILAGGWIMISGVLLLIFRFI